MIRSFPAAPIALAVLVPACFDGGDALGLPCETDDDCGVDQSCDNGFCGGEPKDSLGETGDGGTDTSGDCGDGTVDSGEDCDNGPDNGPNAACTPNCTNNVCGDGFAGPDEDCDEGGETESCDADCTTATCGDGMRNATAGEQCDDGDDNGADAECLLDCTKAGCGDGMVGPGEECDGGMETADCNVDCTMSMCGDGVHNATANEACDGDAMCLDDCRIAYFADDMESGMGTWSQVVTNQGMAMVMPTWMLSQSRSVSGQTSWHSGVTQDGPGTLRLESPSIDLRGATAPVELTFQHWYEFDDCNDPNQEGDGSIVEVEVGAAWTTLDPVVPYPHTIDVDTCMPDANPFGPIPAWAHSSGMFREVRVVLDDYVGETVRLGFHIGYDCGTCNMTEGWYVDDVIVAGF